MRLSLFALDVQFEAGRHFYISFNLVVIEAAFIIVDVKIRRNGKDRLMTRRQTVPRIIQLDHLCDKVLFRSAAEKTACHCQCHASQVVGRVVEGQP